MNTAIRILAVGLAAAAILTGCRSSREEVTPGSGEIHVNFEGIVTEIQGNSVTLDNGKIVTITKDTVFSPEPDTGNPANETFAIGNFVQGYTEEDPNGSAFAAREIYLNIVPEGIMARILINFEGQVTAIDGNRLSLDSGKTLILTEETVYSVSCGIVKHYYPHVGSYVQGYTPDDPEAAEITAGRLHAVFF